MGVILDTSVLIEAERGNLDLEEFIKGREKEPFGLSLISVAELLQGVHRAESEKRRVNPSAYVEKTIEIFPIYPFGIQPARIYAQIWANLMKQRIQIGAHDLLIGSTALGLGFSVASYKKRHFDNIEGLKLELLT
jgi:tRNA(fMet)-specific endonuclease VapC